MFPACLGVSCVHGLVVFVPFALRRDSSCTDIDTVTPLLTHTVWHRASSE